MNGVRGNNGFSPDALDQVIQFARNSVYRSATVAELLPDDCLFRRPVRPEDLSIIDFSRPLGSENKFDLGGLIGHRVLLNSFECRIHHPPKSAGAMHRGSMKSFYDGESVRLARMVQPFLEQYLFDLHWNGETGTGTWSRREAIDLIRRTWDDLRRNQFTLADRVSRSSNRKAIGNFLLVQHAGLLPSKQWAVRRAVGTGLPVGIWGEPELCSPCNSELVSALSEAGGHLGLRIEPHRYWQFYLSTAMGCTNLLYSFCWQPHTPHRTLAGILLCRLHLLAFQEAFRDTLLKPMSASLPTPDIDALCGSVQSALVRAAAIYGEGVFAEFADGLIQAGRQWELLDTDIGEQIAWLSDMERSRRMATRLMCLVEQFRESLDMDTFVETLDTCSTTHVHNEHRLVVIESGEMIFWANVGMRLHLGKGEMMLVPKNRLHGSSITTETCVYHQPIIPAEWVARASDEAR